MGMGGHVVHGAGKEALACATAKANPSSNKDKANMARIVGCARRSRSLDSNSCYICTVTGGLETVELEAWFQFLNGGPGGS